MCVIRVMVINLNNYISYLGKKKSEHQINRLF